MARKGRIQVKKKVSRRRRTEPTPASSDLEPHEPRQVNLSGNQEGVPEDLVDELTSTQRSIGIAQFFQVMGAAMALSIAVVVLLRSGIFRGGSLANASASTLSADVFVVAIQVAAALIAMTIFLAITFRMHRFTQAITALDSSREEDDLEFVLGYLRGFWTLLGGSFVTMLVVCTVVFFSVR